MRTVPTDQGPSPTRCVLSFFCLRLGRVRVDFLYPTTLPQSTSGATVTVRRRGSGRPEQRTGPGVPTPGADSVGDPSTPLRSWTRPETECYRRRVVPVPVLLRWTHGKGSLPRGIPVETEFPLVVRRTWGKWGSPRMVRRTSPTRRPSTPCTTGTRAATRTPPWWVGQDTSLRDGAVTPLTRRRWTPTPLPTLYFRVPPRDDSLRSQPKTVSVST